MSYAAAILPDHWRAAGLPLHPFCVGHSMVLQRLGNPFARPGPAMLGAGRGDLALALHVCSRPWRVALAQVDGPMGPFWVWWYGLRLYDWTAVCAALDGLSGYVAEAWRGPRVWLTNPAAARTAGDPLLSLVHVLRTSCGYDPETLFDVPLRRALWEAMVALQQSGSLELMGDEDEALIRAARAERAAVKGSDAHAQN